MYKKIFTVTFTKQTQVYQKYQQTDDLVKNKTKTFSIHKIKLKV